MNKKSDLRRFCETMWIIAKYDVLPWMLAAGIFAAVVIGINDAEKQGKFPTTNKTSLFEKQR